MNDDLNILGEIDVERINIREPDGRLRCVISNATRLPGLIVRGEEHRHDRGVAGLLFFNDEETENGGLVFNGADGETGGSLTFDAYEQDQIVQLVGAQDNDGQVAGLVVNDRPERSVVIDIGERSRLSDQEYAESVRDRPPGYFGSRRVFAGTDAGDALLNLCDGLGRPRLRLRVGADGEAAIEFLDASGQVTRALGSDGS